MNRDPLIIWAVSDGRAGMENQALGLAEAVARLVTAKVLVKRIAIKPPFDRLPRQFWGNALSRVSSTRDDIKPPYPDLWIACGRRTIPLSIAIRGQGPIVVQTQDPKAPTDKFDLILPPVHDQLKGHNVRPLVGSPNRLTEAALRDGATNLASALPPLPRPFATVLIGGDSKDFKMTLTAVENIINTLNSAISDGFGLLVTTSRRTPDWAKVKITNALTSAKAWVWEGSPIGADANPYYGMLGLASRFFVTEESANMLTDAAFTGKPVTLLRLKGGAPKWDRLHTALNDAGILTREGIDPSGYEPLRETDIAAAEIVSLLVDRGVIFAPTGFVHPVRRDL